MKSFLLLALTAGLLWPISVEAFWRLRENEERQCRYEASKERNEFSARKTYDHCKKNIRKRLREADKSMKRRDKEVEIYTNYCKSIERENIKDRTEVQGILLELQARICWEELEKFNSGRINSLPDLGQYD